MIHPTATNITSALRPQEVAPVVDVRIVGLQLGRGDLGDDLDVERQTLEVEAAGRVAQRDPEAAVLQVAPHAVGHAQERVRAAAGHGVDGALVDDDVELVQLVVLSVRRRRQQPEARGVGDEVAHGDVAKGPLLQRAAAVDGERLKVDVGDVGEAPGPEVVLQVAGAEAELQDARRAVQVGEVRVRDRQEGGRGGQPLEAGLGGESLAPVALLVELGRRTLSETLQAPPQVLHGLPDVVLDAKPPQRLGGRLELRAHLFKVPAVLRLELEQLAGPPAALDEPLAAPATVRVKGGERGLDGGPGSHAVCRQQRGHDRRVFDADAPAGALVRRGGVGRVAHEADAALGTGTQSFNISDAALHVGGKRQLCLAGPVLAGGAMGDNVEHRSPGDWVADEVGIDLDGLRHGDESAIGVLVRVRALGRRVVLADDHGAGRRLDAVAADDRVRLRRRAVVKDHDQPPGHAPGLLDAHQLLAEPDGAATAVATAAAAAVLGQQRHQPLQELSPMAPPHALDAVPEGELDGAVGVPARAVEEAPWDGRPRHLLKGLADRRVAEPHRPHRVGRHAEADAQLGEGVRLLVDGERHVAPGEGDGQDDSGYAAAHDGDLEALFLRRRRRRRRRHGGCCCG
ncbi:hypothetical protein CTA1_11367 [Colletotrichum tanaceti]|uniref:Uncharacterized protein n=1 Tax=Colletotrichum tanaceti TaxID=1306861 RepID=A0A4U6XJ35_9PEZI|nr:hypothetical protein CTA1_11367 [Colletotrichum tanaceti]